MTYPKGVEAQIYDWELLKSNIKYVVICEGELDRLLLLSEGIPAVTSTHGVNTFKKSWLDELKRVGKIVVCFDNDSAGKAVCQSMSLMKSQLNDGRAPSEYPPETGNNWIR